MYVILYGYVDLTHHSRDDGFQIEIDDCHAEMLHEIFIIFV